jgi:membrane protein YqaA with SNARE-associated domain
MIENIAAFFSSMEPMLLGLMEALVAIGPLGLFIAAIIGNASLILPLPIDLVFLLVIQVDYFGLGILTPGILGLIVGTGASIGELTGYFIGLAGIKSFEKMKKEEVRKLHLLKERLAKRGMPVIAFFAFTPLPFDVVGIAAGLIRYPMKKFFLGCWFGKVPRYLLIAYAGYFGIPWLLNVTQDTLPIWIAFGLIIIIAFLIYNYLKKKSKS